MWELLSDSWNVHIESVERDDEFRTSQTVVKISRRERASLNQLGYFRYSGFGLVEAYDGDWLVDAFRFNIKAEGEVLVSAI